MMNLSDNDTFNKMKKHGKFQMELDILIMYINSLVQ